MSSNRQKEKEDTEKLKATLPTEAEKRQVLYAKTIELMETFNRFVTYKEWLDLFEKEIASVKSSFFHTLQPGVEKYGKRAPNISPLYDSLAEKIESFKNEFLYKRISN
jgi:hypothetical protein